MQPARKKVAIELQAAGLPCGQITLCEARPCSYVVSASGRNQAAEEACSDRKRDLLVGRDGLRQALGYQVGLLEPATDVEDKRSLSLNDGSQMHVGANKGYWSHMPNVREERNPWVSRGEEPFATPGSAPSQWDQNNLRLS